MTEETGCDCIWAILLFFKLHERFGETIRGGEKKHTMFGGCNILFVIFHGMWKPKKSHVRNFKGKTVEYIEKCATRKYLFHTWTAAALIQVGYLWYSKKKKKKK